MPRALVSVVIPCFNYGRYLPECLESVLSQQGDFDLEVMAIDDASTDETREILKGVGDPRLRVIEHPVNRGHVQTVTEGLAASRGTFVARLDPDDRYRPGHLACAVETFARYPEVGLVYGDVALIDTDGAVRVEGVDDVHGGRDCKGNELVPLMERNFICSPTVVARREAWLAALPVPDGLAFHDWYFTLSIARRYEFYYVHRVLAEYRVHPANHHTAIAQSGSEEASVLYLLDRLYAEPEQSPELESLKQAARSRVYAAQYLDFADKYFGFRMNGEARRCYLRAVRHRPSLLLKPEVVRRLSATWVSRDAYERAKSLVKPAAFSADGDR